MNDTSAEISKVVDDHHLAMTPAERLLAASSLFESARKIVQSSLPSHLTPEERATPFLGLPFWNAMGFGLGLSMADNPARQDGLGSPGRLGWPGAYGTWWVADPAEDMIALMMIQLYFGAGGFLRTDCETAIYQAIED